MKAINQTKVQKAKAKAHEAALARAKERLDTFFASPVFISCGRSVSRPDES